MRCPAPIPDPPATLTEKNAREHLAALQQQTCDQSAELAQVVAERDAARRELERAEAEVAAARADWWTLLAMIGRMGGEHS